ncbi:zinc transport system substrate-binding protein [Eubacterium ruminantium]|nr:zinc transport system substrate-binding protein [Eubacterium ruminantium]
MVERELTKNKRIDFKKMLAVLIMLSVSVMSFASCGSKKSNAEGSGKIKIVCTIFPEYDWVKELIKGREEHFDLTLLMSNGADLHNYQPTAEDILKISECDLFIYVGGESDEWVDDALKEAHNKNMVVLDLMDILGDRAREEELVEGMQGEDEDDHDHEDADDHDHEDADEHDHEHEDGEIEYDEHVWLSLTNAQVVAEKIEEKISSLDKDEDAAKTYKNNLDEYVNKLKELDGRYKETVASAKNKTVVFGDRFPFRYLVDDYGINYYAAFIGCSAETEASFKTVTFLAEKVDEYNLGTVLTIETSDQSIAKTIINNTKNKDQKILTLDSMQGVTGKEAEGGKNYLQIMEDNLAVLSEALNR